MELNEQLIQAITKAVVEQLQGNQPQPHNSEGETLAGKTRMRPILMTALTTILSMSVMVFSQDAGNAMQKGMAVVVAFGLLYATLMTLFIVPVMYDILYRKQPKVIDVEDSDL